MYNKEEIKKENFDMSDSYAATIGYMHKTGEWTPKTK
jgi:hypothetical protein